MGNKQLKQKLKVVFMCVIILLVHV